MTRRNDPDIPAISAMNHCSPVRTPADPHILLVAWKSDGVADGCALARARGMAVLYRLLEFGVRPTG